MEEDNQDLENDYKLWCQLMLESMSEQLALSGVNPKFINLKDGKFDYVKAYEWLDNVYEQYYRPLRVIIGYASQTLWDHYETLPDEICVQFKEWRLRAAARDDLRKAFNRKRPGCFNDGQYGEES